MRFSLAVLTSTLVLASACNALTIAFAPQAPVEAAAALAKRADATSSLLPLNSKCSTSASCMSGFCGTGICKGRSVLGEGCYKNAGCTSRLCDTSTNTCVEQNSDELLHLALTQGKQYTARTSALAALGPTAGLLHEFGHITWQNNAVHFIVDGTHPAALHDKLNKPYVLPPAVAPTHELLVSVAVPQFKRTGGDAASSCGLSVLYNDAALSLPIKITEQSNTGTVHHFLLAPDVIINDVAFTVACDDLTQATVLVYNVKVKQF